MFRALMVLVVLMAVFAGVGFYQGWFHFTSGSAADTSDVTLTVNKDKIKEDRKNAEDKVESLAHKVKDKAEAQGEKMKTP